MKFKQKITGQTDKNGRKNVEIMVPLNYLSNFWRAPDMPLIVCEISLKLTLSEKCIKISNTAANQEAKFGITDTKLYQRSCLSETVKNEAKKQKGRFLSMFLGTLGASLLGNLLTGKEVKAKILGRRVVRVGEGTFRAGEDRIRANQDF